MSGWKARLAEKAGEFKWGHSEFLGLMAETALAQADSMGVSKRLPGAEITKQHAFSDS